LWLSLRYWKWCREFANIDHYIIIYTFYLIWYDNAKCFMNHYFVVVEQITSCLLFIPINPLKPHIHHILYNCVPKNLLVHSCRVNEETCTYAYFINVRQTFTFTFTQTRIHIFAKFIYPFLNPNWIFLESYIHFHRLHSFWTISFILTKLIYYKQCSLPSNAGLY